MCGFGWWVLPLAQDGKFGRRVEVEEVYYRMRARCTVHSAQGMGTTGVCTCTCRPYTHACGGEYAYLSVILSSDLFRTYSVP